MWSKPSKDKEWLGVVPGKSSMHKTHTKDETKVDLELDLTHITYDLLWWQKPIPLLELPSIKQPFPWPTFLVLQTTQKEPWIMTHSFGPAVTMRGKHNCTPAWVSLETHGAVERRSHTHKCVSSHCHHQQLQQEQHKNNNNNKNVPDRIGLVWRECWRKLTKSSFNQILTFRRFLWRECHLKWSLFFFDRTSESNSGGPFFWHLMC